jgi:serine/threonine protein kinase
MISKDSGNLELKLIDFGLSAELASSKTKLRKLVGSTYYIAPEVVTNQ